VAEIPLGLALCRSSAADRPPSTSAKYFGKLNDPATIRCRSPSGNNPTPASASGAGPQLGVLLVLAIAGGLLPDPSALAILLAALSSGRVLLGLASVVVFSLGFATTLVVVGVVAAQVGQRILDWLSSIWAMRAQIATTLLILGMGVVLTVKAAYQVAALAG